MFLIALASRSIFRLLGVIKRLNAVRFIRTSSLGTLIFMLMTSVSAQPQQTIPTLNASLHKKYKITHLDMDWEQKAYRLYIAEPVSRLKANRYYVVFVLDGNAQFPMTLNALDLEAEVLPLVVGLGYPVEQAYARAERTRDYTFPASGDAYAKGGGAEAFYRFLLEAVKPYIERNYPVHKDDMTLFGHSFGGLFSLYVLIHHSKTFDHYVLASPSLWWGDGRIMSMLPKTLSSPPKSVLVTLGEYEESPEKDPQMNAERRARIRQRQTPLKVRDLHRWLQNQSIKSQFILFPKKNHGSSIQDAIAEMVKHVQTLPLR